MNKNIKRKKFNISLLGETEVGKTRMTNYYLGKEIGGETSLSTIGIESVMDKAVFDGIEYKFKIYDTAGQERYRSISKSSIKITDGFLLVFSVINKKTFERIGFWYDSIKEEADVQKKVIILVGNKIDLEKREVSKEEATNYAQSKNMKYFETSAKTGCGIKEVFNEIYQDVYNIYKNNHKDDKKGFELGKNNGKRGSRC